MKISNQNPGIAIWMVCGILASLSGMPFSWELFVSKNTMSWLSALNYCGANNGSLIKLDCQDKWDIFTIENQQNHNGQLAVGHYWIGMNTTSDTCQDYYWPDSTPAMWTKWDSEYPKLCRTRKCIKLTNNFMRTALCSQTWVALCEKDSNLTCLSPVMSTDVSLTTNDILHMSGTENTTISNIDVSHITSTDNVTQNIGAESITTSTGQDSAYSTHISNDIINTITSNAVQHTTEVNDVIHTTTDEQCCCNRNVQSQLTPGQLKQMTTVLKETLTVMKSNTSINRRKRISVYDSRPSSVAIGSMGCVVLVLIVFLIVSSDLIYLLHVLIHVVGKKRDLRNNV